MHWPMNVSLLLWLKSLNACTADGSMFVSVLPEPPVEDSAEKKEVASINGAVALNLVFVHSHAFLFYFSFPSFSVPLFVDMFQLIVIK